MHLWNKGHWRDYLFSQAMLLVASLLLVFFISIGLGVGRILDRFLSSDLPEEQVRVTPQVISAGSFQTERGGVEITDALLDSLEKMPQVARIDRQVYARVPAYLRGLLGGRNYYTDITLEGVTEAFVPDSLLERFGWDYTLADSSRTRLPIILSENLLLLYNAGFADPNGLMGLTQQGVVGLECQITLGASSLTSLQARPVTINAQIVGTSRNMALFALAVPIGFVEEVNQMYLPDHGTWVTVPELTKNLCGRSRPVHFQGVATVVCKLFNLVQPTFAAFGEKDWQQLAMIRKMTRELDIPVRIEGRPIVREADGLAMSSRNVYLTPEERAVAPHIQKGLCLLERMIRAGEDDCAVLRQGIMEYYAAQIPTGVLDYLELVDPERIETVDHVRTDVLAAVALRIGKARLIDNKRINLEK